LPPETRQSVANDKNFEKLTSDPLSGETVGLKSKVAWGLTGLLDRSDFYTEEAFKGAFLEKDVKEAVALGERRTPCQTARLNWDLLSATFPTVLPRAPADFRIVRVKVLAGQDVILVLSGSEMCQWVVEVEKGAAVTKVILCGYYTQELTGVNAPVIYRAYFGPDGKRTKVKYFRAYNTKDPTFERFTEAAKELTGKDFTSFQGQYQPKGKVFEVRPGTK
jgi:hypothetical protein